MTREIKVKVVEFANDEGTDNNYCGNGNFCKDCAWKTAEDERSKCRERRLRLLTEDEQDKAIKRHFRGIKKRELSELTIKLMSYDALCVAQDEKTAELLNK